MRSLEVEIRIPSSDMRWRNTRDDPPPRGMDVLGLFHHWDSTNQMLHSTVHQCCLEDREMDEEDDEDEDGIGWVIIMGWHNAPEAPHCVTAPCPAPTFWCELVYPHATIATGGASNTMPSVN